MARNSPALLVVAMTFVLASCQSESDRMDSPELLGKKVYMANCKLCHGADGQLGLNGASNLALSILTKSEAVEIITHGRNTMQPFETLLTEKEIDAVAEYILTLRNTP